MNNNHEIELLLNLDKLHTTDLGIIRIKENLSLNIEDVVAWCREKIQNPDAVICRRGKNWYVEIEYCEITVNAHSYTIITAHKMKKVKNRKLDEASMNLQTERLILRPWLSTDAEDLYEYAKNQEVGPIAGWPVHTSVENSLEIIKNVLAVPETYAVCLKSDNKAIGSIGLMIGEKSNLNISGEEAEIGYWIGVPFWGQGLIPEAVRELMRYAFHERNMKKLWCGYFDGNEKSKRVQEKCGFRYQCTKKDVEWAFMNDIRTEHITCITKEQWEEHVRVQ